MSEVLAMQALQSQEQSVIEHSRSCCCNIVTHHSARSRRPSGELDFEISSRNSKFDLEKLQKELENEGSIGLDPTSAEEEAPSAVEPIAT